MIDCPNCGRELRPDSSNPHRMKCTNCDYVLDGAADSPMGAGFTYTPAALHQEASSPAPEQWQPEGQPVFVREEGAQAVASEPAAASQQPNDFSSQPMQPAEDTYWGTQGTGPAAYKARQAEAEAAARMRAQQAEARSAAEHYSAPQPGAAFSGSPTSEGFPGAAATQPYAAPNVQMAAIPPSQQPAKLPMGFAITALVLGILALLNCWIPFVSVVGLVLGVIGLIFGIIGLVRAGRNVAGGKGMAIAGTVCSSIGIVVALLMSIFSVMLFGAIMEESYPYDDLYDLIYELDDERETWHDEALDSKRESDDQPYSAVVSNDDAAWTSLKFMVEGAEFTLMETTLDELAEQGGWKIDLVEAGYPNGYIVQAGEEIEDIPLEHDSHGGIAMAVSVLNTQKDQQDLGRCALTAVWVHDLDAALDFKVDGEVGIGKKLDDASAAYGSPNSEYGSSTGSYRSVFYNTSDYSKTLRLVAGDSGLIDEIGLTAYVD